MTATEWRQLWYEIEYQERVKRAVTRRRIFAICAVPVLGLAVWLLLGAIFAR